MLKRLFILTISLLLIGQYPMAQTARHIRVGVVLPLKEKTTRGAKMVEFYQGLLLSVDSLKHDGISVDVQAVHSGATASEMDDLISSHTLQECDVIFGPLDGAQLPALADYCDLHQTHLVVPFSNVSTQLDGHPYYYIVNAPRRIIQSEAIWYIRDQFPDHNIILVESNERNEEGLAFGEAVREAMSEAGVYVRPLNVDGDDIAYQQAFNQQRKNLVILNSSSLKALNQLIAKLKDFKREHPEYVFSLFGYPSWQTYTSQLLSELYAMDTYIYSTFYRNPLSIRNEQLDRQFMNWFHTPMSNTYPRYALMGFDLGCFFIRGLSIYGRDRLAKNIQQVPAYPFQHSLFFEQSSEGNGYVNTFVQLIHYTTYQSIELLTRNH